MLSNVMYNNRQMQADALNIRGYPFKITSKGRGYCAEVIPGAVTPTSSQNIKKGHPKFLKK